MRAAPAVRASLGDAGPERVLVALVHVLTGAGLAAWAVGHAEWALSASLVLAVTMFLAVAGVLGLGLARSALPADAVHLQWDGQAWRLGLRSSNGSAVAPAEIGLVRLVVALDLGAWLLLRLYPAAGGARWQVVRAACVGSDWHGLRVALAAHAGTVAVRPGPSASPGPRA